jgi:hypothetical protein
MTKESVCCKNRIQGELFSPFPNNRMKYCQHNFQYRVISKHHWLIHNNGTNKRTQVYLN